MMLLMTLLLVKHFIVDFPIQLPYQWMNKGTYGHFGGILHSLLHAIATGLILLAVGSAVYIPLVCLVEFHIHYHIDWAKMNLNKYFGLECNKHARFWDLVGIDQLLHNLTYIGIVICCTL